MAQGISVLLILLGLGGIALSFMMFGDIKIAGLFGSTAALLSGMGIASISSKLMALEKKNNLNSGSS